MMKICLVTENHPKVLMGGAEYQTHLLAEELASREGVEVHYLARRVPPSAGDLPYTVHRIGDPSGMRRRGVFFDLPTLRNAIGRLKPDAIYQQMKQSYSAVCASYATKAHIPFFLHIASEWDLDPSWTPLWLSLNTPFDVVEAAMGNWGLRRAGHVIVQTEAQADKLRARFHKEPAILIRTFQPLPPDLRPRPPGVQQILWVGNLKEVKRPELYVELAASMTAHTNLHFHMVGRPWTHRKAVPLMERIAQLPNFTFHGELPIARVNQLMAAASFYVNTSAHEGFPNTYIQAWANGAVLLSLVVDPYNGMEERGIGFLTGTVEGMKARLLELSDQPQRRDELARQAFEFAHRHHSPNEGRRLADAIISAAAAGKNSGD